MILRQRDKLHFGWRWDGRLHRTFRFLCRWLFRHILCCLTFLLGRSCLTSFFWCQFHCLLCVLFLLRRKRFSCFLRTYLCHPSCHLLPAVLTWQTDRQFSYSSNIAIVLKQELLLIHILLIKLHAVHFNWIVSWVVEDEFAHSFLVRHDRTKIVGGGRLHLELQALSSAEHLDVLRLGIVPQAHLQRFNKVFGLMWSERHCQDQGLIWLQDS
mmetsp:Transcript_18291/g.42692  ORF Transcript_18291/g.42692 Transcript_18291/m.42692 type:complete len:212 (-) Transcript_18291:5215-5850(-)